MNTPDMKESIMHFAEQFAWAPEVLHGEKLKTYDRAIVCGMGGSHLAADVLAMIKPELPLTIWSDYGLPRVPKEALKKSLVIASSYSGNTEETIDAFRLAGRMGIPRAVIASGGVLVRMAMREKVPAVIMPDWHIQPRAALGLSLRALLALLGERGLLTASSALSLTLKPARYERSGELLARALHGTVPVVYASDRNRAIAYNWKIKFNETGKIPAFYNVVPELNHNEMTGFDATAKDRILSKPFQFLFITDTKDHPRVSKRMRILARLYRAKGLPVREVPLAGGGALERTFGSLLLADWTAYHTARTYDANPTAVPMVEKFKKLMR